LLVFRRGANVALPPEREFTAPPLNPPASTASAEQIARGRELYDASCVLCHDDPGNAGGLFRRGLFPDLAYSPALASREAFASIVIDGARAANGMASFSGVLDAEGADAIRAYVIADANAALPANSAR
jgi:mono/diheme cytochrome c family protein